MKVHPTAYLAANRHSTVIMDCSKTKGPLQKRHFIRYPFAFPPPCQLDAPVRDQAAGDCYRQYRRLVGRGKDNSNASHCKGVDIKYKNLRTRIEHAVSLKSSLNPLVFKERWKSEFLLLVSGTV